MNIKEASLTVLKKIREAGYESYFVGGCVRDEYMGAQPKDYDIATNAKPNQIEKLFDKTIGVGAHFGVQIVVIENYQIEVATYRSDGKYTDGRHPDSVNFGTLEEDIKRRDFTINGLAIDPISGKIIDLVDGQKAIDNRIVTTIGDPGKRFSEDRLRMLRAIRFASRLNFNIENNTFSHIKQMAKDIKIVSLERQRDELIKIITSEGNDRGLTLLEESGLLESILPEVSAMKGIEQPPAFHPEGDVFEHTVLTLKYLDNPSPTLAMAALLHDIGKPPTFRVSDRIRFNGHSETGAKMAYEICVRLKFSNEDRNKIVKSVKDHMRFMHVQQMRIGKLKAFLAEPNFREELELHRADCLSSHGDISNYNFCKEKLSIFQEEDLHPKPFITGRDLIALGLSSGKLFSTILENVFEQQMEGIIIKKEQAIEYIKENWIKK